MESGIFCDPAQQVTRARNSLMIGNLDAGLDRRDDECGKVMQLRALRRTVFVLHCFEGTG
jgi:hypothetical protein